MHFPDGEVQHVVRFDDTPWGPCPPTLPDGCEMAVLDGDPQGEDLFTLRFQTVENFVMPPHWHPKDERVTVIRGTVAVAFGADTDRQDATEFGSGDYYVNARDAMHQVWIDRGTILQITGIGPWKVIPAAGQRRARAISSRCHNLRRRPRPQGLASASLTDLESQFDSIPRLHRGGSLRKALVSCVADVDDTGFEQISIGDTGLLASLLCSSSPVRGECRRAWPVVSAAVF